MGLCRGLLLILVCISTQSSWAQNLVPNGSFEEYSECPDALNQTERALGWSRYRGSPDYFHACNEEGLVSVPNNMMGFQQAAVGEGYVGVITWTSTSPNNREHLGAALLDTLQIGMPVYISYKISPATDGMISSHSMHWTASGAGLRFTMNSYLQNQAVPLPNAAALFCSTPPLDTSIWYTVSGVYIPDSAYTHVVLGSFMDDELVISEVLNNNGAYLSAYVYYDEICVSYNQDECDIEMGVFYMKNDFKAYPNPFSNEVNLNWPYPTPYHIYWQLEDIHGRIVKMGVMPKGVTKLTIVCDSIRAGSYILRATTPMGVLPPVVLICVKT